MASNNDGYWSRSWALLTRDKGWIKPLLVLSAANMIPIVGQFGAQGYALEWGRLTAWGVDSSPKQKGVDLSACIRSGARAFVVGLGYMFCIGIVSSILQRMLGDVLGGLLGTLISACTTVLVGIATLRATIYQSIGAGYEVGRIVDMVKRDYEGLLRIVGLVVVMMFALGIVVGVLLSGVLVANMGEVVRDVMELERASHVDDLDIALMVLRWIGTMLPALLVLVYVAGIVGSGIQLIATTAIALWMRQFDVRNWGESSDPLPASARGGAAAGSGYPAAGAQGAGAQGAVGYGQAPETAQAHNVPQQVYDVPQAVDPVMPQPAPSPAPAVSTFSLDDVPEEVPTAPAAEEPPAAEPEAHAPILLPASSVETFSLDDEPVVAAATEPAPEPAPVAPAPEPADQPTPEPAPEPEDLSAPAPFTLDDAIAQTRAFVETDLTDPLDVTGPEVPPSDDNA